MRNKLKYFSLSVLLLTGLKVDAQSPKLLDRNINHPSYNSVYPSVSGDGRVMVYMTDYSDDGNFAMMMSKYRGGKWQNPVDADVIGSSKINNWGGYSLNYDGSEVYFSSRRSNGVGVYDVWHSEFTNGNWQQPRNIGKPINSPGHEGNPSISPDGQRIYFMRCESMTNSDVRGCKILYSEKGPRGWNEPVELPDHINIGNTTSPRILPDNRTLVFASDRKGGKGGVDLWMSKRSGEHWSEPVNVEPVNTSENDFFLSVSMRSIAFLTREDDKGKKGVAELRLPPEFRLDNVIIAQGTIKDQEGNNLAAEVRVFNKESNEYEVRLRLGSSDEDFTMIMPEGAVYDVAYSEQRQNKMYKSELVDATEMVSPRRELPKIVLPDLEEGLTFSLTGVGFEPNTTQLAEGYDKELSRLTRVLEVNPEIRIEIGTYQKYYIEDTTVTNEDLTETRQDTTYTRKAAIRIDTLGNTEMDNLIKRLNQELSNTLSDTTIANLYLARMAAVDSISVQEILIVYHNDRSEAQAEVVKESLINEGIGETRVTSVGYRDAEPPVNFPANTDRMVVVKLLSGADKQ